MNRKKRAAPKRAKRTAKRTTRKRAVGGTRPKTVTKRITTRPRKAKYKVGDFVYSTQNPTEKRQINDVKVPKTPGAVIKYRLTMCDCKGRPKNSKWIAETSLRKTKRS